MIYFAAIALGWTARALGAGENMLDPLLARFLEFAGWRQLSAETACQLGPDAAAWHAFHPKTARDQALLHLNQLPDADFARRFSRLARDFDTAGPARVARQRAGLENPNGPKPPVEPGATGRRYTVGLGKQTTANLS